ncbi:Signal transducer regulating beta-lactamase production, contains metallopeptidase domain [Verrucomicrobium sp. GAS474]|uniref:M56 family metallopeptidase n=1 Tax=Verrucomicrobium sp. GAS474 TaxID=1882831 RepID=UPI00087A38D5|nr:M56 family metallopeptidase [Verrucomicrobium sp. GAS474]SDU23294.1 Signal transducer regulating beta-lactamase production, contains metallopeptidase domain [Verrucomicrobium sp. GAS474]
MSAWSERLGWMLIHSVWIGTLLALGLRLGLALMPERTAKARYTVGCAALIAMAVLPWWTFASSDFTARMEKAPVRVAVAEEVAKTPVSFATVTAGKEMPFEWQAEGKLRLEPYLPWLTSLWFAGVTFFLIRLARGWHGVRALARSPLLPVDEVWRDRFAALCGRAGVARLVRFGESAAVTVPMVAGWFKPVILFPLGVMASLPVEQVEAILLHELAHIRRHDAFVNLLQAVCEALFFYHPAVWYISRVLREERENACDDLVVSWSGDALGYAEALAAFEGERAGSLALAASGEGELLARVRRLLGVGEGSARKGVATLAVSAIFLGVALYLGTMFLLPLLSAKVMTAAERIASIKDSEPEWQKSDGNAADVSLSGTLRTEDGLPLPRKISLNVTSRYENGRTFADIQRTGETFAAKGKGDFVWLSGWAAGYAPFSMQLPKAEGGKVGPVEVVFKKGIPARIRVVSETGAPLPGVKVEGWVGQHDPNFGVSEQTGSDGTVSLGQFAVDTKAKLTFFRPGWQKIVAEYHAWEEDKLIDVVLRPSIPARGIIVDEESGRPVAGAEVQMAAELESNGSVHSSYGIDYEPQILAHSDEAGRFVVNDLSEEMGYRVYVKAAGYPLAVFPLRVGEGVLEQTFPLEKGMRFSGKIVHPRGRDGTGSMPSAIICHLMAQLGHAQAVGYDVAGTLTVSSSGEELFFSFDELPSSHLVSGVPYTFQVGGRSFDVNLKKDTEGYVFDLAGKDTKSHVEIFLNPGRGQPMPGGALHVYFLESGVGEGIAQRGVLKDLPLSEGHAEIEVPAPNRMSVSADRLLGYWFPREDFDIKESDATFSKKITLVPAGVIRGRVVLPDGSPSTKSFFTHIDVVKAPSVLKDKGIDSGEAIIDSAMLMDRYQTTPLPFGGTYRVFLWAGTHFEAGEALEVDAAHPIVERDMTWHPGVPVQGALVDGEGKPVGGVEISLNYRHSERHSFGSSVMPRASDGTFSFEDINFDVPGFYEIVFKDPAGQDVRTRLERPVEGKPLVIVYPTGEKR